MRIDRPKESTATGRTFRMTIEDRPAPGTIAIVVATAAITLAIGVTAAALTSYYVPSPVAEPQAQRIIDGTTSQSTVDLRPTAPSVVLVPIAPNAQSDAVLAATGESRRGTSERDYDRPERSVRHEEDDYDDE
jgi:hypothetical protein